MRGRCRAARSLGVALLAVWGLGCAGEREPSPVLTDAMGLFDAAQHGELARQHELLLRDYDIDYRVDVVTGGGDLLHYGAQRFEALAVGSRSRTGRGLLLVLDPLQDEVRLEVGRNLEGVYPDAFVAHLQEEQMVPFFRLGHVAKGILAATELIVTRAQEAQASGHLRPPGRDAAAGGKEVRRELAARRSSRGSAS